MLYIAIVIYDIIFICYNIDIRAHGLDEADTVMNTVSMFMVYVPDELDDDNMMMITWW